MAKAGTLIQKELWDLNMLHINGALRYDPCCHACGKRCGGKCGKNKDYTVVNSTPGAVTTTMFSPGVVGAPSGTAVISTDTTGGRVITTTATAPGPAAPTVVTSGTTYRVIGSNGLTAKPCTSCATCVPGLTAPPVPPVPI